MTLICRKDDMAICTRTISGVYVGHIVDVVEYAGRSNSYGYLWWVRTRNGLEAMQPDSWMTPIRPGDLDEKEETEKVMEFFGK